MPTSVPPAGPSRTKIRVGSGRTSTPEVVAAEGFAELFAGFHTVAEKLDLCAAITATVHDHLVRLRLQCVTEIVPEAKPAYAAIESLAEARARRDRRNLRLVRASRVAGIVQQPAPRAA